MKLLRFSLRPVVRLVKKYAPWALPVGRREMAPVVRSCVVVVMIFMDLSVLAKLEAAVLCVVNGKVGDNLAWAEVTANRR